MLSAEGKPLPINDNLEAMAKQLYDYWFVQFDFPNEEGKPYKSSGGVMVWNEKLKREIPQGWDFCVLEDLLTIRNGRDHKHLADGIYPVYGSGGEMRKVSEYLYDGESVLMPRKGSLNNIMYVNEAFWTVDTMFYSEMKLSNCAKYIYYTIKDIDFTRWDSGTGVPSMTSSTLYSIKLVKPQNETLKKFDEMISPLFEHMKQISEQNVVLTKQRDELLPLLMNGQASVNYHLSASFLFSLILYRDQYKFYDMKETIIQTVLDGMRAVLTENQLDLLTDVTRKALSECEITPKATEEEQRNKENVELLGAFISSKKVEGCSDKTIHYYKSSIEKLIATVKKNVCDIATNDIRCYLAEQQEQRGLSKVTIDNLRRIYSSFFSWLEDEDYITKSPVRRIHKVRTDALVKEVLTDENIEVLRDSCQELRDIAMIDLLLSTGMRVGELVKINRDDIDFQERQCVVFGKGNKEREVYFNARTKIHLKKYLEQRTDTNPALFVSLHEPHTRLTISGVEVRLRQLGKRVNLNKVHPHKFRRTLATMAIDKGMPIEQVQKMLGHVKIDTTLHYAMVNQTNVKIAHRKFLN